MTWRPVLALVRCERKLCFTLVTAVIGKGAWASPSGLAVICGLPSHQGEHGERDGGDGNPRLPRRRRYVHEYPGSPGRRTRCRSGRRHGRGPAIGGRLRGLPGRPIKLRSREPDRPEGYEHAFARRHPARHRHSRESGNPLLPFRAAHPQDTAVAGEGGQLGDFEIVYELFEARVVCAVQF